MLKKKKDMLRQGMRWGIKPIFGLPKPEPTEEDEEERTCGERLMSCMRVEEDEELEDSEDEKCHPDLRGKRVHIKLIQDAVKLFAPSRSVDADDDDEPASRKKTWFDAIIINTADGKRSTLLDIWRIYIAFLSIISALLGLYMGAYQIEI